MDGPRQCHTEWSQTTQISYDTACMWNLKKSYKWTYLQNTGMDVENKLMFTGESKCVGGINGKTGIDTQTLLYIK